MSKSAGRVGDDLRKAELRLTPSSSQLADSTMVSHLLGAGDTEGEQDPVCCLPRWRLLCIILLCKCVP